MKWKINILIGSLLLCVGILLGTMLTRSCQKPKEIVQTDTTTVVRIDTITKYKPVPVKTTVTGKYYFDDFKLYAFIPDTVYIDNSFQYKEDWKVLEQQVKEYRDSTYYAKISGINAFLEEITVYPKTVTKYVYKEKKVVESPDKWVLYGKAEYESIAEQNFAKIGGGLEYRDKGNTFAAEGGKEFIGGQWYFKGVYKRDIFGWK